MFHLPAKKLTSAVALAALLLGSVVQTNMVLAADAICYNCPPQWADWASQLKSIKQTLGYELPHDNKNSG